MGIPTSIHPQANCKIYNFRSAAAAQNYMRHLCDLSNKTHKKCAAQQLNVTLFREKSPLLFQHVLAISAKKKVVIFLAGSRNNPQSVEDLNEVSKITTCPRDRHQPNG